MTSPAGVVSPTIGVTGPTAPGDYQVVLGLGMEDAGEIWALSGKEVTLDGVTVATDDEGDAAFPLGALAGLDGADLAPSMELGDGRYVLTVRTMRDGDPVGRTYAAPLLVGSAVPSPTTPGTTTPGTTTPGTHAGHRRPVAAPPGPRRAPVPTLPGGGLPTAPGTTTPGNTGPGTTGPGATTPGTTAPGTDPARRPRRDRSGRRRRARAPPPARRRRPPNRAPRRRVRPPARPRPAAPSRAGRRRRTPDPRHRGRPARAPPRRAHPRPERRPTPRSATSGSPR